MKRLLGALTLAVGLNQAEAADTGMTAPLVAEHCEVTINAKQLTKIMPETSAKISAVLDVTSDEITEEEKESALEYLAKVKELPYSKMNTDFARLQRETVLEDPSSISSGMKTLKSLQAQLIKADEFLDSHTQMNAGGTVDVVGFIPQTAVLMDEHMTKAFEELRTKGINCNDDVKTFTLKNARFPGEGELIASLVSDANADTPTVILPEVEDFEEDKDETALRSTKATFVKELGQFQRALLVSETKAERIKMLIASKYLNTNQ